MNKAFRNAIRDIFTDGGQVIFLLLVPLAYPLIYAFIYTGETVREVPVAVVDERPSSRSRDFLRRLDATPDVHIVDRCPSMEAARAQVERRRAYGIVCLPADFSRRLERGEQAHVSAFIDMSGMLYYKAIASAATDVSLALNAEIKMSRAAGTTARQGESLAHPLRYEQIALFNPHNGFAAFLLPAVLIVLLQQTLTLGIGLEAGTRRERMERSRRFPPTEEFTLDRRALLAHGPADPAPQPAATPPSRRPHASRRALRSLLGRGAAFLLLYVPVTAYCLFVVPRLFALPQVGDPLAIALFMLPFLLAVIGFAVTLSALPRQRESIILLVVFASLPLLFLSGVSWPASAMPWYWKTLSYLSPSTPGINGFIRLNSMGATLPDVAGEYLGLWCQALGYGCTAWWITRKNELLKISLRRYAARH